jgi:ubiquinone/menaquinone biosynthesis C-methylase UbiE
LDHNDHVNLIRDGVAGTTWADLGSGSGAFTLALADVLGPGATIYSMDRDASALRRQAETFRSTFPDVTVRQLAADFTRPLDLPQVDGIVMANSLHFVRDKETILPQIVAYIRDGGRFLLVEYDTDRGNGWVPFPVSFETWTAVAAAAGLHDTRRIGSVRSRFLGSIYSAVSLRGLVARP